MIQQHTKITAILLPILLEVPQSCPTSATSSLPTKPTMAIPPPRSTRQQHRCRTPNCGRTLLNTLPIINRRRYGGAAVLRHHQAQPSHSCWQTRQQFQLSSPRHLLSHTCQHSKPGIPIHKFYRLDCFNQSAHQRNNNLPRRRRHSSCQHRKLRLSSGLSRWTILCRFCGQNTTTNIYQISNGEKALYFTVFIHKYATINSVNRCLIDLQIIVNNLAHDYLQYLELMQ